jgi:hypothetical protein
MNYSFSLCPYSDGLVMHYPSLEMETSSVDCAKQSRFYLRTQTNSSLRNVVFN